MATPLFFTHPELEQCANATLLWGGGTPPYTVTALNGNGLGNRVLAQVASNVEGISTSWLVAEPADTLLVLSVQDSKGQTAKTNLVAVGPSTDTSCLTPDSVASSTAIPVPTGTTNSTATPAPTTHTSPPIGLIIGIGGGVIFLLAVIFALWFWRRQRSEMSNYGLPHTEHHARRNRDLAPNPRFDIAPTHIALHDVARKSSGSLQYKEHASAFHSDPFARPPGLAANESGWDMDPHQHHLTDEELYRMQKSDRPPAY